MEHHMIIETTDNRFFRVRETGNPDLAHLWVGDEMRFDRKQQCWIKRQSRRGGVRPQLINKDHCYRIVDVGAKCAI